MSRLARVGSAVARVVPVVSAVVAVGGLLFGIFRFVAEQKASRELRINEQLRAGIEQLLNFPGRSDYTISRMVFVLDDLLVLSGEDSKRISRVTDVLVELISQDCDFNEIRHIRLDTEALKRWPDYHDRLKTGPGRNDFILYKYFQALRQVHSEDPSYVESIAYVPGEGYKVKRYTDEERYLRLERLIDGFKAHLEVIPESSQRHGYQLSKFIEATNNPALAEQVFGVPEPQNRLEVGIPRD